MSWSLCVPAPRITALTPPVQTGQRTCRLGNMLKSCVPRGGIAAAPNGTLLYLIGPLGTTCIGSELRAWAPQWPDVWEGRPGCWSPHGKSQSACRRAAPSHPLAGLWAPRRLPQHTAHPLPALLYVLLSSNCSLPAQFHSSHGIKGTIRLQRPVDSSAGEARGRQGAQVER